jgi:hypothetical protein
VSQIVDFRGLIFGCAIDSERLGYPYLFSANCIRKNNHVSTDFIRSLYDGLTDNGLVRKFCICCLPILT